MRRRRLLALPLAGLAVLAAAGCGGTGVTPPPLERSIATTFANLYVLQQQRLGNRAPDPATLRSRASCLKGTPGSAQHGAGSDWVCTVTYLVAGPSTPVNAVYAVTVQTDGCYAADGDGPATVNGSRTVTGPGFRQVTNPLALIQGCFQTT